MEIKNLDNKGQVLIMFVLFIPLILLVLAFITDTGVILYNEKKLDSINKIALDYVSDNIEKYEEEKVKEIINKNDSNINITKFYDDEDKVIITINKDIDSIFGNIIGIKNYKVSSIYKLYKKDKKIIKIKRE